MYTRSYPKEEEGRISIPEKYGGTAFIENAESDTYKIIKASPNVTEESESISPRDYGEEETPESQNCDSSDKNETREAGLFGGVFDKIRKGACESKYMPNAFRGFFLDFGLEEMLIIGVALFLIFSKSADIECAVMILLLLFIK